MSHGLQNPILATRALTAHYGDFQALFGVDIHLCQGETVAIIGANGAGKSTLLRSIAGVLRNAPDSILFENRAIGGLPSYEIIRLGIAIVPEGRRLFPSLSVEENLLIGRYGRPIDGPWSLDTVYHLFPALSEKRRTSSSALSGGQQQMVAIARALMSNPTVLLCDEISLGLAPIVVRDIYAAFPSIKASGTSILLVEQDVNQALKVSDRIYCLMEGRVTLQGAPDRLSRKAIHDAYFGVLP
jgi:branched-chain amino acid transport system ATP-binding protein